MIFSEPAWRRTEGAHPREPRGNSLALGALLAGASLLASGCPLRPVHNTPAVNWRMVSEVHPSMPSKPVLSAGLPAPPDLAIVPPQMPQLFSGRTVLPPKPRGPSPEGENEASDSAPVSPAAPVLSPELTPDEQSAAQRQAQQSLHVAQRNLAAILGRKLSTTQTELSERVRSFIVQASEALRGGDVLRARNLAQKAELLSYDLVKSQ